MKITSKILIICLSFSAIKAIVFFNPLVNDDGSLFCFQSQNVQGILGWIDVPCHISKVYNKNKIIEADKVFAIKLADNFFKFILLSCPNIILPNGLYCWQSSWKKYVAENDTLYQSLTRDVSIINKLKAENKPIMYVQTNPYDLRFCYDFDTKKCVYRNPKVPTIIEYKNDSTELLNPDFEIQNNCFNAVRKQFYDVMGTTETFMREYLGAEPDQFILPVSTRDYIKIPKVEKDIIKQYFPPKLDTLKRDIINLAGKMASLMPHIYSTNDLNMDQNKSRLARITILDPKILNLKDDPTYSFMQLLQMEPAYNDAIFNIFTNFDGLETILSDYKSLIEDISLDQIYTTQANLIFRKYYQKDINLLEDLKDNIKVKDGIITEIKKYPTSKELEKIKNLYFYNVPITYCGSIVSRVNYLFSPIVNINSKLKFKAEFVEQILELAIKNAFTIAKINNKKKIIFNLKSLEYYGYDSKKVAQKITCIANTIANHDLEIILID